MTQQKTRVLLLVEEYIALETTKKEIEKKIEICKTEYEQIMKGEKDVG